MRLHALIGTKEKICQYDDAYQKNGRIKLSIMIMMMLASSEAKLFLRDSKTGIS